MDHRVKPGEDDLRSSPQWREVRRSLLVNRQCRQTRKCQRCRGRVLKSWRVL